MKNIPLLLITLIGTVALIIGLAVVLSQSSGEQAAKTADPAQLVGQNAPTSGPDNAKVTLVEFADFQCPACQQMSPYLKQILDSHPNDVRLVYRYFPLVQIHKYAQISSQAGAAVYEIDKSKFWAYHDVLFEKQQEWEALSDQNAAKDALATYAEQLGIDKATFLAKIESDSVKNTVNGDVSLATQLGLNSTPTIFLNGKEVLAQDFAQLPQKVESMLQ